MVRENRIKSIGASGTDYQPQIGCDEDGSGTAYAHRPINGQIVRVTWISGTGQPDDNYNWQISESGTNFILASGTADEVRSNFYPRASIGPNDTGSFFVPIATKEVLKFDVWGAGSSNDAIPTVFYV